MLRRFECPKIKPMRYHLFADEMGLYYIKQRSIIFAVLKLWRSELAVKLVSIFILLRKGMWVVSKGKSCQSRKGYGF